MAKDDYEVIACKMLVFFYKKLKGELSDDELQYYLYPVTPQFPISQEYFNAVLLDIIEQGLIADASIERAWGGDIVSISISRARITMAGVEFLKSNSSMQKVIDTIKEAIPIIASLRP